MQQPVAHEVALQTHLLPTRPRPASQPQMPCVQVAQLVHCAPPIPHFELPPFTMQVAVASQQPLTQVLALHCQGSQALSTAASPVKRRIRNVMPFGVGTRRFF